MPFWGGGLDLPPARNAPCSTRLAGLPKGTLPRAWRLAFRLRQFTDRRKNGIAPINCFFATYPVLIPRQVMDR